MSKGCISRRKSVGEQALREDDGAGDASGRSQSRTTGKSLDGHVRIPHRVVTSTADQPGFTARSRPIPGGAVVEEAVVRRGTLSGPYRRYFEDGTLEHSCYYKAGEISADYWPGGQPSTEADGATGTSGLSFGKLQKRFVADKACAAVEPVRLWHENGRSRRRSASRARTSSPRGSSSSTTARPVSRPHAARDRSPSRTPGTIRGGRWSRTATARISMMDSGSTSGTA